MYLHIVISCVGNLWLSLLMRTCFVAHKILSLDGSSSTLLDNGFRDMSQCMCQF